MRYDERGHVLEEIDANGTITVRSYQADRLRSEARSVPDSSRGSARFNFYDPSQGGRVSGTLSPSGLAEVYCYRVGASADCAGGTLTTRLQWKARLGWANQEDAQLEVPSTFSQFITEKTTYTYGAVGAQPGGGLLREESVWKDDEVIARRVVRYGFDSVDRPISTIIGSPSSAFSTGGLLDANGNRVGSGSAFNAPQSNCGGLDGSDMPASDLCTHFRYDRLERVERVDTFSRPGVSPNGLVQTQFHYDAHGNLESVTQSPGGTLVTYEHDDFGNVIAVTGQWMRGTLRQEFDARGNVVKRATPSLASHNQHQAFAYDGMNRPLYTYTSSAATLLWQYGYDSDVASPPTNCPSPALANTAGRIQWKDDSFGRTWYEYDSLGNVVRQRRVRAQGATLGNCSTIATASSDQTPDTEYTCLPDGRLSEMKYPHGRRLRYTWGDGLSLTAPQDRVVKIEVQVQGSWRDLIRDVRYDVGGEIAAYFIATTPTPTTVEWLRSGSAALPSSCSLPRPTEPDGTGRLWGLFVRAPGSSANTFQRWYSWTADQLAGQATCLLDETTPQVEGYSYDGTLQVTGASRPTGQFATSGGPWGERAYRYANGSDRDWAMEDSVGWESHYDSQRLLDRVRPRLPGCANRLCTEDSSWASKTYAYDEDGRLRDLLDSPYPQGLDHGGGRHLTLEPEDGFGAVYRSIRINGLDYEYWYDGQGRRRAKRYPIGATDEFFYDGEHLIEDRGNTTLASQRDEYILDEYVWLGGVPVAVLKSKLDVNLNRTASDVYEPQCNRNDEAEACGVYHLVNDYLPKPVLMLDDSGRVAGVGDYDIFGRANRVTMVADAPAGPGQAPWPFGPYLPNRNTVLATARQPARTSRQEVLVRVNYAAINIASKGSDATWLENAHGQVLTQEYSGQALGAINTPWVAADDGVRVRFRSDATAEAYPYTGVTVASYEYRRYEVGASPWWPALRFPGQYADAESQLLENWNRFYDAANGRYTAPDPLNEGEHGVPLAKNSYAYANSNPLTGADPTGRVVVNYEATRKALAKSARATAVLDRLHRRKDMTFLIVKGVPRDGKGNQLWGAAVPPKTADTKLTVLIINEAKIAKAGDAKANYFEIAGHEMSHGEQMQVGQNAGDYLQQDAAAYGESISIRLEQNLALDATWLDGHPAAEFDILGIGVSPARTNENVNFVVQEIREGRPILPRSAAGKK